MKNAMISKLNDGSLDQARPGDTALGMAGVDGCFFSDDGNMVKSGALVLRYSSNRYNSH